MRLSEPYSLIGFVNECCEGMPPGAKNRLCYAAPLTRFYQWYSTYCAVNRKPKASISYVAEYMSYLYELSDPIDRSGVCDREIIGIMLVYSPLKGKKKCLNSRHSS